MDPNEASGGRPSGWVPPPGPAAGQPQPGSWSPPPGGWPAQAGWGAPQQWAPEPKRKRFGWGALIAAFLGGGFLSAVVVIGGLVALALAFGTPDSVAGTHPAGTEATAAAKVGDCLQGRPGTAVVIDRSQVVDCDLAHNSEVATVVEVPGFNHRPSGDDLKTFVDDACSLAFQGYVGSDPDESQFGYAAVVPSDSAWAAGDRTVWCLVDTVGQPDGAGTVRGSRR